ncbi:MAG: crotonyl-CoA carboxylase/reductase, partial [Actinomycetota bacterium]|nr:crotonyl-CoA carboxylase/reductase [Actinomycetota bacterium]
RHVDFAGIGAITVGLTALVLALVEGNTWHWGSARVIVLLAVAAVHEAFISALSTGLDDRRRGGDRRRGAGLAARAAPPGWRQRARRRDRAIDPGRGSRAAGPRAPSWWDRSASTEVLYSCRNPFGTDQRGISVALERPLQVASVDTEPGELPETMAAWVIRPEREGEPSDAFQLEEIEVPQPGAFEVIVRVMAAGVNYNNVWAALGQPVSVFGYGDHPQYGHHIGGSDASGIVWKVGEGVTRWKPGDEVIIHCNQASYEDPEVHGLDPLAAPSQRIWGYETTWGSFAQFTKVQAQQLLPRPRNLTWEEAASYGLVYFTAYRMLITQCDLQAGNRVLIWGAAGGLGVFATQLCAAAGAECVGVVSSPAKGELVKQLGAVGYIDRIEFAGMMRRGGETAEEEKARFRESRRFTKALNEILGGPPDIVFEHVGRATFPTSVLAVKPFGKVVICAGTTGYNLDFDVRYLWMRQKQIIGSHFANAYECMKANELIEQSKIRPVLWRTMGFEGVPEAHQLMKDNKHLGKISILVGATEEGRGKTEEGPGAIRAEVGA